MRTWIRKRLARYEADIARVAAAEAETERRRSSSIRRRRNHWNPARACSGSSCVGAFSLAIGGIVVHMIRRKRIGG